MRAASAAKPLTELLANETDAGVIEQTSLALANLAAKEAVPVLKHAALNENPQTRGWVLQAIGRLGDKRDVSFLAKYLEDPAGAVSEMAAQAIERIAGVDFGFPEHEGLRNFRPAIQRARTWWKENKALFPEP
jgi:HEAT repeat protein